MKTLNQMQIEVREVNEANGWFDHDRSVGDGLALIHSEVSEWLEAYRDHGLDDATVGAKPEGVGSEAADVLIRLLDECDRQGIDLEAEYERKITFNRSRGHRHGGKRLWTMTRRCCVCMAPLDGPHWMVHTRYGNGGGGNKPCPMSQESGDED